MKIQKLQLKRLKQETLFTVTVTAVCAVLGMIILFLPNIIGVADDGSVARIMSAAGLSYPQGVSSGPEWFVREYVWKETFQEERYRSIQLVLIRIAKWLNATISGTRVFDIRFLAAVYLAAYIPAIYIFTGGVMMRIQHFGQRVTLSILIILMFADVSYISYMNSLYPEALLFLLLLFIMGAVLHLNSKSSRRSEWLFLFIICSCLLCAVRSYCFLFGFIAALFCALQYREKGEEGDVWRILCVSGMVLLTCSSVLSFSVIGDEFHSADKFHAMTRGVMLQAEDPEKTMEEFGIDQSYSILADVSMYDAYPMVKEGNPALEEQFLSRYNEATLAKYYIRHPLDMLAMSDLAVKANVEVRRNSCGNYEKESGMPAGGRSIFWSGYSIYKNRNAPKTIGYYLILMAACMILAGNPFAVRRMDYDKTVYFEWTLLMGLYGLFTTFFIIIKCGDVGLGQYNNQFGMIMDFLLFFAVMEILDRLNIFEKGKS